MLTQSMQDRLDALGDQLQSGRSYDLMPSDARGDGYDIVMAGRPDESGDYLIQGMLCRVQCVCWAGTSRRDGIPAMYRLDVDPDIPYVLRAGESAVLVHRTGTKIGNGYMHRVLCSIAIRRADGRFVYRNHTPYWIATSNVYAEHYKSGLSKRDADAYQADVARLQSIVDAINATSFTGKD